MGPNWPGSGPIWHRPDQNWASSGTFRHVYREKYMSLTCKHAEFGRNWPGSGPVRAKSAQNRTSSGPFRHVFRVKHMYLIMTLKRQHTFIPNLAVLYRDVVKFHPRVVSKYKRIQKDIKL